MRVIHRALLVQAINYQANIYTPEKWVPGLINADLYKAFKKTTSIGERRYPPLGKTINDGQFVLFVNKYSKLANGSVLFTVCAYRNGHVPESFNPDFSKSEAEVKAIDIVDEEGNKGELVHTYRCLAYGQVLIVELVSGGGGIAGLQRLLGSILRISSEMKGKYPKLKLKDIIVPDLKTLIESHGGVTAIKARAIRSAEKPEGQFGKLLSRNVGSVSGANKCAVEWTSDKGETLDTDTSIDMMQEVGEEYMTGVSLTFKDGGGISDLSEYVEKRVAEIPLQLDGRPSASAIEYALKQYLESLCEGASGSIKSDGTLKNTQLVSRSE